MMNTYCRCTFSKDGQLCECSPYDQCDQCKTTDKIKRLEAEKQSLITLGHETNKSLRDDVDRLTNENRILKFMIDNGLGWDDLKGGSRADVE